MENKNEVKFSPAIPTPFLYDVQKNIEQLRSYLEPNDLKYQREEQHTNIRVAIKLYEDR